jgi:hypothetical protein
MLPKPAKELVIKNYNNIDFQGGYSFQRCPQFAAVHTKYNVKGSLAAFDWKYTAKKQH